MIKITIENTDPEDCYSVTVGEERPVICLWEAISKAGPFTPEAFIVGLICILMECDGNINEEKVSVFCRIIKLYQESGLPAIKDELDGIDVTSMDGPK